MKVIDSREGVAKQALRLLSEQPESEDSPRKIKDVPDMGVYVTSLKTASDEFEYKNWCRLSNVPFMGLLP